MNIKQLQYMLAINEEGSLNKAAVKMYISQPALSQQLMKLEHELGETLFDRTITPLRPTDAGREFLKVAQRILLEYREGLQVITDVKSLARGEIVLGIPRNRGLQALPYVLPPFRKLYPGIRFTLNENKATDLEVMLEKGTLDLAFMISDPMRPEFEFIPLFEEKIFMAVPDSPEYAVPPSLSGGPYPLVDCSVCAGKPFIAMKPGNRLRVVFEQHMRQYGPEVVLETDSIDVAHRMAAAGFGMTIITQLP